MKKIFAMILAIAMLLSFASCAADETKENATGAEETKTEAVNEEATKEDASSDKTVGQTLLDAFKASSKTSAEEIANELISNEIIQFMGGAMPIEEGFLSGFDNTEIKGFKEGAMFAPMIGTIPFVGYIFVLEEGSDVEAFKTTLSDNANLRWNICVSADEKIVDNKANTVFFLMCPASFEQPEEEAGEMDDMGGMALGEEDMVPAAGGEEVVTAEVVTAEEIA